MLNAVISVRMGSAQGLGLYCGVCNRVFSSFTSLLIQPVFIARYLKYICGVAVPPFFLGRYLVSPEVMYFLFTNLSIVCCVILRSDSTNEAFG